MRERDGGEGVFQKKIVRASFFVKVKLGQRPEGSERIEHAGI